MNANQVPTSTGITQIIAGTGGNSIAAGTHPNSNIAVSDSTDFGVLQLTLNSTGADYAFKTDSGTTPDSGTVSCKALGIPTVASVNPTWGPVAGGSAVTITGTNLASATAVKFGSTPGTVTADSATSITATAPSGTGTVDVTVTTPGGTSATSSYDKFTYGGVAYAPTRLKVTPQGKRTIITWSAPANDGGFALTGYQVGEASNKTATGGKLLDVKPLPVSKRTFVLNNLPPKFRGYFFVAAINAGGVGTRQWHRFINGRVPFAPTHLSVTSQGTSTILKWRAPANGGFAITGYQVREVTTRSALAHGGLILNRRPLSAKSRSFKITNLKANFNGYLVVFAINARGGGNRAWRHFIKS
jgi:hypothetical protein